MWRTLLLFTLFLVSQLVGGVAGMAFDRLAGTSPETGALSARALAVGLLSGNLLLLALLRPLRLAPPVRQWFRRRRQTAGTSRRTVPTTSLPQRAAWGLLAVVGFVLLNEGVGFLLFPLDLPTGGTEEVFAAAMGDPLFVVCAIALGPLTEECVFRLGMRHVMARRWLAHGLPAKEARRGRWTVVATSALLFAVAHMNLAQGVPAFVMGVALMLFYLQTGTLWLPLAAHMANNALAAWEMSSPLVEEVQRGLSTTTCLACGVLFATAGTVAMRRALQPLRE